MKLALGPLGRLEDGAERRRTRERNTMKTAKMCPDPGAEHPVAPCPVCDSSLCSNSELSREVL
jgi:hypothetical protein